MATQTKPAVRQQQPPAATEQALGELEQLAKKYAPAALEAAGRFARALLLAQGIRELKAAVEPILQHIKPLAGSALGFLTDKPYGDDVVASCLIEATLRGVYPVGNEFNIISGRCYITKEGYRRLVRELPGLTDLVLEPGVPKGREGGAVVPYRATWKYQGRPGVLVREIPVRLNQGMGADGAIGKATRKALKAVYEQLTGSEQTDPDEDLPEQRPPQQAVGTRPDGGALGPRRPTPEQLEEIATLRGRLGTEPDILLTSYEQAEAMLGMLRQKCRGEGLFPEDEAPAIQNSDRL